MKNKYLYTGVALFGAVTLGLTSCNNDEFLNVNQYNVIEQNAMFETEANAKKGLNGVYDMLFPNDSYDGDWGFKPNLFTGSHPTIDSQATGWDKDWNSQNWNENSTELLAGWKHVYAGICRANDYLANLEKSDKISEPVKKHLEGEARAIRGFFFHWLATTFGRVPMLATGENYVNTPTKKRAETYVEMWDFIIEDFKAASELLDWTPMDGQYGRATKGMALAYLADSYMWKAYRVTDGANGQTQDEGVARNCYQEAEKALESVLNSGTYKLNESFTTLWDPASAWGPEAIWVEQLDEGNNWGQWGNLTSKLMLKWYTACPENGGWGSLYLSWEWWSSFEKGDKRREGSACTGAVPQIDPKNPKDSNRDRFVLSKGHTAPGLYSTLALRGYFPVEDLKTLRHLGSYLQGHPDMKHIPGVDMSSGSLGQGISAAVGMALSAKLSGDDYRVYTLLGDGEIQEGQVWEAAMFAGFRKLDNLVVIVDNNGLQIDGPVDQVCSPYPIDEKFKAFNFHVINLADGNDMDQIAAAFAEARETKGQPVAIIAHTVKGKGVSFMENQVGWHGKAPNDEEYAIAMADLEKEGEALCQK